MATNGSISFIILGIKLLVLFETQSLIIFSFVNGNSSACKYFLVIFSKFGLYLNCECNHELLLRFNIPGISKFCFWILFNFIQKDNINQKS